jgi:hypothetical protein
MKYTFGTVFEKPAVLFSTTTLKKKTMVCLDKKPLVESSAEYVEIKDRRGTRMVCKMSVVMANATDIQTGQLLVPLNVFREM